MYHKFSWSHWLLSHFSSGRAAAGSQARSRRSRLRDFTSAGIERFETRTLLAAQITAVNVDSLFTDVDTDGVADPGDTLQYDVTITNNVNMDATGVSLFDTEDMNTTLVGGSIKITPVAFDDGPYMLTGNTPIMINAASGVLANDIDPVRQRS